jgi:hypothetical protein
MTPLLFSLGFLLMLGTAVTLLALQSAADGFEQGGRFHLQPDATGHSEPDAGPPAAAARNRRFPRLPLL